MVMIVMMLPVMNVNASGVVTSKNVVLHITKNEKEHKKIKLKTSDNVQIIKTTYKSSNKKIVKVTKSGKMMAVKKGKAVVTIKITYQKGDGSQDTKTIKCNVKVEKNNKIRLSETEREMKEGESFKLKLLNAKNKTIEWSNDNTSVIVISSYDKGYIEITAVGPGEAHIQCECGGKIYDCIIVVKGENGENNANDDVE